MTEDVEGFYPQTGPWATPEIVVAYFDLFRLAEASKLFPFTVIDYQDFDRATALLVAGSSPLAGAWGLLKSLWSYMWQPSPILVERYFLRRITILGGDLVNFSQAFAFSFAPCSDKISRQDYRTDDLRDNFAKTFDRLSFPAFCDAVQNVCKGNNTQYASSAECAEFMESLPLVSPACPAAGFDATGNSSLCRLVHLITAAYNPTVHCPHVGPTGGLGCNDTRCEMEVWKGALQAAKNQGLNPNFGGDADFPSFDPQSFNIISNT